MRLPLFLLALCLPVSLHAGGIYWTDRFASSPAVRVSGFDGSNAHVLFPLSGADPRGIVVDVAASKLYFGDRNSGGRILEGNLDGSGTPTARINGLSGIADLRFAANLRVLYWCEESGGTIRSAPVSSFTPQSLFSGLSAPYFLDATATKAYWSNNGSSIFSGPIAGGTPDPSPLYSAGSMMRGVRVYDGMLYWCEKDAFVIRRRALAGGTVQDLYPGQNAAHGIALDTAAGKVYWVDTGTNSGGFNPKGVSRGDMDGSGAAEALVTSANSNQAWDLDLDFRTSTYAEWRARFFRLNAAAAITDKTADPDNDGASNFDEYSFGSSPLRADVLRREVVILLAGDLPAIRFFRRIGATDITYTVQHSTDLITWTDNTTNPGSLVELVGTADQGDGTELVTVRSSLPLQGTGRQFFRVKAASSAGALAKGALPIRKVRRLR